MGQRTDIDVLCEVLQKPPHMFLDSIVAADLRLRREMDKGFLLISIINSLPKCGVCGHRIFSGFTPPDRLICKDCEDWAKKIIEKAG